MGKPYDHQYFYAGSGCATGAMICAGCHQPINNSTQDFMSYKKPSRGDWGYVCWHRECRPDPQWAVLDKRKADAARDYIILKAEAAAFAKRWAHTGICLSEIFEDLDEQVSA